jgi:nitrate reductase NapAB chaperone NapD
MPICSYLVQAAPHHAKAVVNLLDATPGCAAAASEDGRAIVLVTDTPTLEAESSLHHLLKRIPGIEAMILTFGYTEPENLEQMSARGLPEVHDV